MRVSIPLLLVLAASCSSLHSRQLLEIGRSTGGIATSIFAFRVFGDGRVELDLFTRTSVGRITPERARSLAAKAADEKLWQDVLAANRAGRADQNAEPGSIWVQKDRQEISFTPQISTIVGEGTNPHVVTRDNVPESLLPLLIEAQTLCRQAIDECKFYDFVPPHARDEVTPD